MKQLSLRLAAGVSILLAPCSLTAGIRNSSPDSDSGLSFRKESGSVAPAADPDAEAQELSKAKETLKTMDEDASVLEKGEPAKKTTGKNEFFRANSFIAGPDWEFDGFVAGAENQTVRSEFVINDLIYLNIGSAQGLATGETLGIYRRGDKIRDPQTGKFIGFEVRRVGLAKITDKVQDNSCSARISRTIDDIEIGDLVRRGE